MGYRKFKADYLLNSSGSLQENVVLVTDEKGVVEAILEDESAGDDTRSFNGLLTPGFVNTHCHLELSHMKGTIPAGEGLPRFLARVIKQRGSAQEIINDAMVTAEKELYESGTVAVGDICNTADSIIIKNKSNILWKNFIEVIGFSPETATSRFAYAKKVLSVFEENCQAALTTYARQSQVCNWERSSLSPHAPYSVSRELFHLINEASAGKTVTIHNQETEAENELFENKTGNLLELYRNLEIDPAFFEPSGKTSLQTYLPWLNKASGIILVHNTYTAPEDISFAQSHPVMYTKLYFCICINANKYIELRNPPLEMLVKNNCSICLGTDSYASNMTLNMLEEVKTIQREFGNLVPLDVILTWSTINGAKALGMDDQLGSFEKGKQPGVVVIDKIVNGVISKDATATRIV